MIGASGWNIKSGGGLQYYINEGHSGIKMVFQNDRARITDIDVRNSNRIDILTGSDSRNTGSIIYSQSRNDYWLRARNYIYYGNR